MLTIALSISLGAGVQASGLAGEIADVVAAVGDPLGDLGQIAAVVVTSMLLTANQDAMEHLLDATVLSAIASPSLAASIAADSVLAMKSSMAAMVCSGASVCGKCPTFSRISNRLPGIAS